jgi:hypothetical protein
MAKFKPEFIITEMKKNVKLTWGGGTVLPEYQPGRNRNMEHVFYIDGEVGPGTFYSENLWFMSNDKVHPEIRKQFEEFIKNYKPKPGEEPIGPQPHSHPFVELFTFFGNNPDDPTDLGGEITFYLEEEPVTFNKSCIVSIPAGMRHCPIESKLDRPIFHFSMGFSNSYAHTVLKDKGGDYSGQKGMSKYFIFKDKSGLKLPAYRKELPKGFAKRVAFLDGDVLPESNFYVETMWLMPESKSGIKGDVTFVDPHKHAFQEVIAFFGSDIENDIHKLHGEVEFTVEGKKYNLDKSFIAIIPEGVEHGPLTIKNIKKPIFHYTAAPTKIYK